MWWFRHRAGRCSWRHSRRARRGTAPRSPWHQRPGNRVAVGAPSAAPGFGDRPARGPAGQSPSTHSALFRGTLLGVSVLATLLIAQRVSDGRGLAAFTPQAATVPGSAAEQVTLPKQHAAEGCSWRCSRPLGGMMLFGSSDDLLTMFVALEVLSLPLYLMCGLARRNRCLPGSVTRVCWALPPHFFPLRCRAAVYGYSGSPELVGRPRQRTGLLGAHGMFLCVGLLLEKSVQWPFQFVGAQQSHAGAPTPVTALASATKSRLGALLRLYVGAAGARQRLAASAVDHRGVVRGSESSPWRRTTSSACWRIRRSLHTGFILTRRDRAQRQRLVGIVVLLFAYGFSTLGAFAVVSVVRRADGDEEGDLRRWAGLGRRHPFFGVVFALFPAGVRGIPLTSGFVSKFAVFSSHSGVLGSSA
ncbi:NADH-quinone oxidoreductase subunit NuoN [Mycolicibacterium aubagnense]